jgi:hypothetical protein
VYNYNDHSNIARTGPLRPRRVPGGTYRYFWSKIIMMKFWSRSLLPIVFALVLPALSLAQISIGVSVNVPPPELPVYDQPPIPGDGYVWTPGFWSWSDDDQDYYWVPGTWVLAPQPDYLWTPGYWGEQGAVFIWHSGYWGPHVGFYGGVNYGYGYGGYGYEGGYWQGGRLYYNRSVNNINNVHITNVYNKTVINNVTVNRVSYNGGAGIQARPNPEQMNAARERHIEVTQVQRQHVDAARGNPALRVSENQGHPPIAATSRPAEFSGAGVVAARRQGTMSVVRPNAPQQNAPQQNAPQRDNTPDRQGQRSEDQMRQAQPSIEQRRAPEQVQPRPTAPQQSPQQSFEQRRAPAQVQPRPAAPPPVEQRRAPEQVQPRPAAPPPQQQQQQPRPSAPQARPNAQRPERPPERDAHERH